MPIQIGSTAQFFQGYLYKSMGAGYPGLEFERIARLPLDGLVPDECHEVVTSIDDRPQRPSMTLYPNPANERLTITGFDAAHGGVVEVLDVMGQPVLTTNPITYPSTTLDVVTLPAGSYVLRYVTATGPVVDRFVKQ